MKKLWVYLIFIFFLSCASSPESDSLIGKTLPELERLYGKPAVETEKVINKDYRGHEIEPDYSRHFADDELQKSVNIKILTWQKNKTITVWLKSESGEWVVFSSVIYSDPVVF